MNDDIEPHNAKQSGTKLLSPSMFYDRLNGIVGKSSIYGALRSNRIKHIRLGRKILILASEVEAWPQREAEQEAA